MPRRPLAAVALLAAVATLAPGSAQADIYEFVGEYFPGLRAELPGHPVVPGQRVSGTFSFDRDGKDWSPGEDEGFYHSQEDHRIELQLGDLSFESDLEGSYRRYAINIKNNEASVQPVRDVFSLRALDSKLRRQLELDNVSVVIKMQDLTAQAFYDDSIPELLRLEDFKAPTLFFNWQTTGERRVASGLRFRIICLERVGDPRDDGCTEGRIREGRAKAEKDWGSHSRIRP
jgi:hypothetical protein